MRDIGLTDVNAFSNHLKQVLFPGAGQGAIGTRPCSWLAFLHGARSGVGGSVRVGAIVVPSPYFRGPSHSKMMLDGVATFALSEPVQRGG